MYKIDRRGGRGGVQKSYTRTDPVICQQTHPKLDLNQNIKLSPVFQDRE